MLFEYKTGKKTIDGIMDSTSTRMKDTINSIVKKICKACMYNFL